MKAKACTTCRKVYLAGDRPCSIAGHNLIDVEYFPEAINGKTGVEVTVEEFPVHSTYDGVKGGDKLIGSDSVQGSDRGRGRAVAGGSRGVCRLCESSWADGGMIRLGRRVLTVCGRCRAAVGVVRRLPGWRSGMRRKVEGEVEGEVVEDEEGSGSESEAD